MADIAISSYCGGLFQTNGYLIKTGEKTWLFDAPGDVVDWLVANNETVDGLLLTHQHHDHVIGAGAVVEQFGCPIWAWSEPSEALILTKNLERMTGMPCELDPYSITHVLEGETELSLDGLDLSIIHVPGHSPDSICFRIAGQPILIGGDVLFAGGIGRTDFPNGDHELLLNGIKEKLWPLPDDTHVLPGHGPTTMIGEEKATNPFLR